jgi:hypothetical protein
MNLKGFCVAVWGTASVLAAAGNGHADGCPAENVVPATVRCAVDFELVGVGNPVGACENDSPGPGQNEIFCGIRCDFLIHPLEWIEPLCLGRPDAYYLQGCAEGPRHVPDEEAPHFFFAYRKDDCPSMSQDELDSYCLGRLRSTQAACDEAYEVYAARFDHFEEYSGWNNFNDPPTETLCCVRATPTPIPITGLTEALRLQTAPANGAVVQ